MVNNYDVAVLSEKVAHLESAVANSTSASGIAYDNTDSGLTATDAQAAIDEISGELETETATIVTKVIMNRNGKNRFLILDSVTIDDEAGVIVTLPEGDRPATAFGVLGRYYDTSNKYHPCFISILANGEVKASSILTDGSAQGLVNGVVLGSVSYII